MKPKQIFKNRAEAFRYLGSQGYGIKDTKFYDDCKAGKCQVQKDKTVFLVDLLDYIETHLAPGSSESDRDAALSRKERELDIATKEEKLRKYEIENRKNDSDWIQRRDHDEQVAAILGTAMEMMRQRFSIDSSRILHATGGDVARMPELVNTIEQTIEAAFNDLAGAHEFDVVFGGEGEEA